MNIEAEQLITDVIISKVEVIVSRGTVSADSAKLCAVEIIKALKNLDAERAFLDIEPYSIQHGRSELWEMFLNEILK